MVTVARCYSLDEAVQLRMLLESAGIQAFIPDEATAGIAPYQFLTPSGVRLQVADEDAEEAKEIIEQQRNQ